MLPPDPAPIVLSHVQIAPLLAARTRGERTAVSSTDLGLSHCSVALTNAGIVFPGVQELTWADAAEIEGAPNSCFVLDVGVLAPVRHFSEQTGRLYSLMPTESAPTMLVSGIPMHRIKGTDPLRDTLSKIKAVGPPRGRVLDTATGLGYTAIEAARSADSVLTIELDPAAQGVARFNPWSQRLFTDPKIVRWFGDSAERIVELETDAFDLIIHDPPAFSLAGSLYSAAFYRQAWRVLARRGRMFHYIGSPDSRSGAVVTRGVVRRLREVGFARLVPAPQAFGVVAYK